MKKFLLRFLEFFRVIDSDNNISITNVAVIIVLYKLAATQSVSIVDTGALLISLSHYSLKKVIKNAVLVQNTSDLIQDKLKMILPDKENNNEN